MVKSVVNIGGSEIGGGNKTFVIAEAGVNHNGNIDIALKLIEEAKRAGADCVKFQTFRAESLVTKSAPKAAYQLEVTDPGESQFDMLKNLELSKDDYLKLMRCCKELDIIFLSTPYNIEDADFLYDLGVDGFKIASGQLVELPFLEYVAALGRPMIVSTGMATLGEVYDGVTTIRNKGNKDLILLQCTTNYPSLTDDANLRAMVSMGSALDVQIGYSDHTETNIAMLASVAMGAVVVEKHFTLDITLPGPDHSSSFEPDEFATLVEGIRDVEKAMGSPVKEPTVLESKNIQGMRRSLVVIEDVEAGEELTLDKLGFKRPATGIEPARLSEVVGKKAAIDIKADTILTMSMIQW